VKPKNRNNLPQKLKQQQVCISV